MLEERLQTFLTLCETMHYRKTAEQRNLTQPAVTQQIQWLERAYGCALFHYDGRKLQKLPAAELLETYARTAIYNEVDLRERLAQPPVRTLRVGATKSIGDFVVQEEIAAFLRNSRDSLSLMVDNTEHLLEQLDRNILDFALIEGLFDKQKYAYQLFRQEPFVGICSPIHPFAGRAVALEELWKETILIREHGSGTRAILEQILQAYSFSLKHFARQICISSFELIKYLVAEGIGISFVYEAVARSSQSVATFTLEQIPIKREFNYVYLKNTTAAQAVECFRLAGSRGG